MLTTIRITLGTNSTARNVSRRFAQLLNIPDVKIIVERGKHPGISYGKIEIVGYKRKDRVSKLMAMQHIFYCTCVAIDLTRITNIYKANKETLLQKVSGRTFPFHY